MAAWLGAAIPAVSNLVGGLMNFFQGQAANQANAEFQERAMKEGIRWRVADAKAAGVSPIVALGAPTFNPAPAHIGDTSLGESFARAGQDVSRSITATRTQDERTKMLMDLQLERSGLENELLRSRIARENATPMPPAPVLNVPLRRTMSSDMGRHQEAGEVADAGFASGPGGQLIPVPSKDVKERIEDNWIQEMLWSVRNNLYPSLRSLGGMAAGPGGRVMAPGRDDQAPSKKLLPRGFTRWEYDVLKQAYVPRR